MTNATWQNWDEQMDAAEAKVSELQEKIGPYLKALEEWRNVSSIDVGADYDKAMEKHALIADALRNFQTQLTNVNLVHKDAVQLYVQSGTLRYQMFLAGASPAKLPTTASEIPEFRAHRAAFKERTQRMDALSAAIHNLVSFKKT